MTGTIVPYTRFVEVLERRQRVEDELAQRSGKNASLWKLSLEAAPEPPRPIAAAAEAPAAAVPDPLF